ncbi:MAG: serine/threonine protein kinase [Gammaproteobacteria bacterium]
MEDDLTIADLRTESDADSLLPGSKLHWYRIDSVLGHGDYWFTYLASDLNLGRPVIITEYMPCAIAARDTRGVIHPAAAEHGAEYKAGLECFLTDARKLTGIRHQNIAQALNAFEANNSAYVVIAHGQGKKAEQLFDGSTVAEKELLAFVLPILDGLETIHASGYIHRYIQPSNIIIRPDGSPVLTGFNPANTLTKHFSSGFAPIELCFGDGELHGPWTDIFSVGAMLYQAVVGVAPVAAIERSRMVLQGGTDPLMSVLPVGQGNHSDAFLKAIDHALGFLPTQRPLTVAAWRNELSGKDSLGIADVIRPESEQLAKLREDLETHKLRAQEDHKRRAAERANEEEWTVKKLLDQRLVEETRHLQAEENANTLVAPGRGTWLGYSAAIAGIVGLGLSLAWVPSGSFTILYDAADEWLSGNLFSDEPTETIPEPATQVPVPDSVAKGREDGAGDATLFQPSLDQEQSDPARTGLDEAIVIAPESEAVASLGDDLTARETRRVSIREATASRVRVRPGETVRFYTDYSLTLPARDKEAHVKATWALLRGGRKIGREGIDNRYARAGLNTAVTELTLPPRTASGQYTVEHRVQVGDSFDVAHSRFVLAK